MKGSRSVAGQCQWNSWSGITIPFYMGHSGVITYAKGRYVTSASQSGVNPINIRSRIHYSDDLVNWTNTGFIPYDDGQSISSNNNGFVFASKGASGSFGLYYSLSGDTWSGCTLDTYPGGTGGWEFSEQCLATDGNIFVATSRSTTTSNIFYSNNITGFTYITSLTGGTNGAYLKYVNDKFFLLKKSSNMIYYSSDGKTWNQTILPTGVDQPYGIAYGNGTYVIVDADTGYVCTSTDGINWTATPSNIPQITGGTQTLDYLYYINCQFIVDLYTGGTTQSYTSTDGITWTRDTSYNSSVSGNYGDTIYVNNTIYRGGNIKNYLSYKSVNVGDALIP